MSDDVRDVVIIGSGPAGLTAALYTARANLHPLVIEGLQPGGQLTITTMVENWPGHKDGVMGPQLMADMRAQAEHFGTAFMSGLVERVDLSQRPFTLTLDGGQVIRSRTLIVATGASAKLLGLPSEMKLMGRGVSTCATCDGFFFRNRPVAIVGGGDTAIEEALYLSKLASHVTVIHRRDTLRASKIMQDKAFANPKISFRWNTEVEEIVADERGDVNGARLRDTKTGVVDTLAVDGVFVAIGHTPNTALFKGQLDMDEGGYLVTTGVRTNVAGVFAAGDVQDPVYRQAITSAGAGCMAAIDAERWLELGDAEYHHGAAATASA
ncbi:thioredoxin reductase [Luteitalea sp. TBR-22]|uniref:thioredoxin-disulfide reductase n=1 Tax=Luteitalea sp. TBR-22 TaxID=2802971 RepID=UPI001AF95492|nr:thioredoxin-disulfide reductase [Luteitalea sp. TBR-22]BCS33711.1 thioredoxin reductase [Luteitalea sp. TBR-22]